MIMMRHVIKGLALALPHHSSPLLHMRSVDTFHMVPNRDRPGSYNVGSMTAGELPLLRPLSALEHLWCEPVG